MHPNTVRAWSDAGRLRYYRINPRGDRRYRLGDLQRFLAAAESRPRRPRHPSRPVCGPVGAARGLRRDRSPAGGAAPTDGDAGSPRGRARSTAERDYASTSPLIDAHRPAGAARPATSTTTWRRAAALIRDAYDHHLVAIWELRGDRLVPRAVAAADAARPERLRRPAARRSASSARPSPSRRAAAVAGRPRPGAARAGPLPILPGGRPSSRSSSPVATGRGASSTSSPSDRRPFDAA